MSAVIPSHEPAVSVLREVPLAGFTTLGVGGPARYFTLARSGAEIVAAHRWARRRGISARVIGNGSNLLVDDAGVDGLVIRVSDADERAVRFLPGGRVRAESAVPMARLIGLSVARGLSGLEHFAGIPAALGGALYLNLHFLSPARDRLMFLGDVVESARIFEHDRVFTVGPDWFDFGYDHSVLVERPDAVVLDATLRLTAADPHELRRRVRANLAWRGNRHPPEAAARSAGSVFRNPPGASAARLIDAAGLKGTRVGGAAVSTCHANFIINLGGARADDVHALIERVQRRVEEHSGLRLEPEVKRVA